MSHVLVERRVAAAGFDRMVGWSAVAHVAPLVVAALLMPAGWFGARAHGVSENVIRLEITGAVGPRDGGMTAMPARPVQRPRDVQATKAIEPVRPSASRVPEMIEPTKTAPKILDVPGNVMMQDTKSESSGLNVGGSGAGAQLAVGDFCCPDYIATMQELINRHWTSKQMVDGITIMTFTIQRDGTLTAIQRERSSGHPTLDYLSERALRSIEQLPPLPAAYTQQSLIVHLTFEYYR